MKHLLLLLAASLALVGCPEDPEPPTPTPPEIVILPPDRADGVGLAPTIEVFSPSVSYWLSRQPRVQKATFRAGPLEVGAVGMGWSS